MDLLEKFGPLLGQVAPSLATALGGPLAGVAVKTLSNALFGHEDATEQQISDAMASATPDRPCAGDRAGHAGREAHGRQG